MNDLERIEGKIAAKRQKEALETKQEKGLKLLKRKNLQPLLERLVEFRNSVRKRVYINVTVMDDYVLCETGSYPLWLRNGACSSRIAATESSNKFDLLQVKRKYNSKFGLTVEQVIYELSRQVEDLIETPDKIDYGVIVTKFYKAMFYVVFVLSGLLSWVLFSLKFGLWGFLLGWLPSLFIGGLAGATWPLLILGSYFIYQYFS